MADLEGARLADPIAHTSALAGLLAGVAAGLAVGLAVVAIVGTGGVAAIAVGAGIAAGAAGGGLAGQAIGEVIPTPPTGSIATGSVTVFHEHRPAVRAGPDTVPCSMTQTVAVVAQGSSTVFINRLMAARRTSKTVCGATISEGAATVLIGGATATVPGLEIDEDVPAWLNTTLNVVMWAGTIVATGGAAAALGWGVALGGLAGGLGGGYALGWAGEKVGRAAGGELGARIGSAVGGFVGGMLGGMFGARAGASVEGLFKSTPRGPAAPPESAPPADAPETAPRADAPETPPADAPERPPEDAAVPPDEESPTLTEDAPENRPPDDADAPERPPEDTLEEVPDDAPDDAPDAVDEPTNPSGAQPIRSGLGGDVDAVASLSPSLRDQIATFTNDRNGTIRYGGKAGDKVGSYYDAASNTVVIDPAVQSNPVSAVEHLSHEIGHALDADVAGLGPGANGLRSEGVATLNNAKVRAEILAAGGPDIGMAGNPANHPQYQAIYEGVAAGTMTPAEAALAIARIFATGEFTNIGGVAITYLQYFTQYFGSCTIP